MFDFINRAASISDPAVVAGLDALMPFGGWRAKLDQAERDKGGPLTSEERKHILVGAFTESLRRLGDYQYVAETTILRPLQDRPLYCLCYATRHERGIEVFRDCQIKALTEQSRTRAATKIKHAATMSGQGEFFESLHDMGPDELNAYLAHEKVLAEQRLLALTPTQPYSIPYAKLWPQVMASNVVRRPEVNAIATALRERGVLLFPDWERGKGAAAAIPRPKIMTAPQSKARFRNFRRKCCQPTRLWRMVRWLRRAGATHCGCRLNVRHPSLPNSKAGSALRRQTAR